MQLQSLIVPATEYTPGIHFDPSRNKFEINGESRPENVKHFYAPVIKWVDEFKGILESEKRYTHGQISLDFKIRYFNSASANFIMGMLIRFDEINKNSKPVIVNWYYNLVDVEMKETGEEFEKMLSLPFNYISYN